MIAPNISLSLVAILLAYFLGAIPFGVILAKLFGGTDVRKSGSGNIGATNVARVVGPLAAGSTLIFGMAQGAGGGLLAGEFFNRSARWVLIPGISRLPGHRLPLWLH